jgi:transcriptional regulator with XRE-family HTH domain
MISNERPGLSGLYISRVENGYTVPSIETLEMSSHALGMPLYQLLYEGDKPPKPVKLPTRLKKSCGEILEAKHDN